MKTLAPYATLEYPIAPNTSYTIEAVDSDKHLYAFAQK